MLNPSGSQLSKKKKKNDPCDERKGHCHSGSVVYLDIH